MATSLRPLSSLKRALREVRAERYQCQRRHATSLAASTTASSPLPYPPITPGGKLQNFHPGNSYRHHREKAAQFRELPVPRSAPAIKKICPDPISVITASSITALDPRGVRTRLFSPDNPERVNPGDVVMVRMKNSDPVSGVVLNIRRRTPVDTAILLRNQLTRVGVEMWVKVYSPNVTGIEVVQRKEKRARRARLYYMRSPKHDMGSVDGLVRNYIRQRQGGLQGMSQEAEKKKGKKSKKR